MKIESNGSKWYGQEPDSIEQLVELLRTSPLDPSFEGHGNFAYPIEDSNGPTGEWQVWGNFFHVSHVFRISGTKEEVWPLVLEVRLNQDSPAYKAARAQFKESELTQMEHPGRLIGA